PQGALADGRYRKVEVEILGDRGGEAEPLQPGGRQDDGVQTFFLQLSNAGLDIAADYDHLQVGAYPEQLGLAAQGAGAYPCALREVGEFQVAGYHRVTRIFAFSDAAQSESFREFGRHILHAMHGDVDFTPQHG